MKKRISLYVALAAIAMTVSCKKTEDAPSENEGAKQEAPLNAAAAATPINPNGPAQPHKLMQIQSIDGKVPVMSFDTKEHDFGTINEGDKVMYDFKFKNTGEAPLIIMDAKGSCGCTVPEFPREPIAPGKEEKIHVIFNSKGKLGQQTKSVTLTCNTKAGQEILQIKSKIVSLH